MFIIILLMIISTLSKILGFGREIALSYFFGANSITDAYLVAMAISNIFFNLVSQAVIVSYIPVYTQVKKTRGEQQSNYFTSIITNILIIIGVILTILTFIFAETIVRLYAPGFNEETIKLSITYTRIIAIGITFNMIVLLFKSYLEANLKFIVASSTGILLNITSIIFIVISSKTNNILLIIGSLTAIIVQLLLIYPFVRKEKFKYIPTININDDSTKKFAKLILPLFLTVFFQQIMMMIERNFSSRIGEGAITSVYYANNLLLFFQGVFITTIMTVIYPRLSKSFNEKETEKYSKIIYSTYNLLIYLLIPITIGAFIYSSEIIELIYFRGNFSESALIMTTSAFKFYSLSIIFIGLTELINFVYYSKEKTFIPSIYMFISIISNIIIILILPSKLGVIRISLGFSITMIIRFLMIFIDYTIRFKMYDFYKYIIELIKVLISTISMITIIITINNVFFINLSLFIRLILIVSVGAIIYGLFISLLNINKIISFIKINKQKNIEQ